MACLSLEVPGALVFHMDIVSSSQKAHKATAQTPSHRAHSNMQGRKVQCCRMTSKGDDLVPAIRGLHEEGVEPRLGRWLGCMDGGDQGRIPGKETGMS